MVRLPRPTAADGPDCPWHHRVRRHLRHSLKWRIVVMFMLLAMAVTGVFVFGAQRAFAVGWRDAAVPLLSDYVAHLRDEVTGGGPSPDLARAQALVQRLPLTLRIDGPRLHWDSHPHPPRDGDRLGGDGDGRNRGSAWAQALEVRSADGHVLHFGLNTEAVERRPRFFGLALLTLLLLTALAWWTLRRMLRPLDDIGAGVQRFGRGDFSQPIPVRHARHPDELGELAHRINTMGRDIHQMLEAKRGLLLAISHELRSPLTRARLHAELLPEDGAAASRQALLENLQEMATLISDLLESERLATPHTALQREATDVAALARAVVDELRPRHPRAAAVVVETEGELAALAVDPARLRLLLRNLLDNALRHGAEAATPPTLRVLRDGAQLQLSVRDHGPGVSDEQLQRLAEAFYRPDSARTRSAGGVGLGLYLCRLVAEAHGGRLTLAQGQPGLLACATLPLPG